MTNPQETAQRLRMKIGGSEREEAERIAERECELIEFRAECAANPDKWRAEDE